MHCVYLTVLRVYATFDVNEEYRYSMHEAVCAPNAFKMYQRHVLQLAYAGVVRIGRGGQLTYAYGFTLSSSVHKIQGITFL